MGNVSPDTSGRPASASPIFANEAVANPARPVPDCVSRTSRAGLRVTNYASRTKYSLMRSRQLPLIGYRWVVLKRDKLLLIEVKSQATLGS